MMTFQKGQSGNPSGRPPNRPDKRNQCREMLQNRAPEIINKAIEMALNGDILALRLCMERIIPKVTGNYVKIDFPSSEVTNKAEYLLTAGMEIIQAMLSGNITPCQAKELSSALESQRKLTETVELNSLLEQLKEKVYARK